MEALAENKIHIQLWGNVKIFPTTKYIIGGNYFPARINLPFIFLITFMCVVYMQDLCTYT